MVDLDHPTRTEDLGDATLEQRHPTGTGAHGDTMVDHGNPR